MKQFAVLPVLMAALALSSVGAQGRSPSREMPQRTDTERKAEQDIPVSMRPPAGMCRIWLDDVPAAQQPAPTDCASAVKNRPAKGRVIFGDDYVKKGVERKGDSSKSKVPIRGFAPPKRRP